MIASQPPFYTHAQLVWEEMGRAVGRVENARHFEVSRRRDSLMAIASFE